MRRAAIELALAAFAVPAAAQRVAYEGNLSVATGTYYFTARTTSWTLGSGLAYTAGPVTLRAWAPVFMQNTTLVVRSGGGMTPTGGPTSDALPDSGRTPPTGGASGRRRTPAPESALTGYELVMGDPMAQLVVGLADDARTSLTVAAGLKFPVTDTSAYGTGEWDASTTVSIMRWLGSAGFVSLDATYWYLGDLPDLELRDVLAGTATLGRPLGNAWVASLSMSGGTAVLSGYDPAASVGVMIGRLGRALWSGWAALGLTEAVPDVSIGLSWRIELGARRL
jgi:hypothetical protein